MCSCCSDASLNAVMAIGTFCMDSLTRRAVTTTSSSAALLCGSSSAGSAAANLGTATLPNTTTNSMVHKTVILVTIPLFCRQAGCHRRTCVARRLVFDCELPLRDQHRALELNELSAVGFFADSSDSHDTHLWTRRRLALAQHLRLGINGVADEYRRGQFDIAPAEVCNRFLADIADAHAHHDRQRQAAVHHRAFELRSLCVGVVEVKRVSVHRQQGEPNVVRLGDGATGPVLVDVAHFEVFVAATEALAITPGS